MPETNLTIRLRNNKELLVEETTRPEIPVSIVEIAKKVSLLAGISPKRFYTEAIIAEIKRQAKKLEIEVIN